MQTNRRMAVGGKFRDLCGERKDQEEKQRRSNSFAGWVGRKEGNSCGGGEKGKGANAASRAGHEPTLEESCKENR
jgi:hypothetical protein